MSGPETAGPPSVPAREIAIPGLTSPFDALRRVDERGEHWSARDLQPVLGYVEWRKFEDTIDRAIAAIANSAMDPQDHIGDAAKMVTIGSGAQRYVQDYRLTRYGAYLVAMNGDPRKPEIAAAQTYFAVKTREAEVAAPAEQLDELEVARRYVLALEAKRELEAQLAEVAPKAQSWDTLASGDGDYSVGDAAKILSRDPITAVGERRLFTVLSEQGWIFRQRGDQRWRVYQAAVERGWLSELPTSHYHPRTGELVIDPPQVRVTVKGLAELHRRLGGLQPLRLHEQQQLALPVA